MQVEAGVTKRVPTPTVSLFTSLQYTASNSVQCAPCVLLTRSLDCIYCQPVQVEAAEGAEEEEGTTRATSSSRATAPEAATAASPMREVVVAVAVDTTVKVSRTILAAPDAVQWRANKLPLY